MQETMSDGDGVHPKAEVLEVDAFEQSVQMRRRRERESWTD